MLRPLNAFFGLFSRDLGIEHHLQQHVPQLLLNGGVVVGVDRLQERLHLGLGQRQRRRDDDHLLLPNRDLTTLFRFRPTP